MIQLIEVYNAVSSANHGTSKFSLREIYVNPEHIVAARPDLQTNRLMAEGLLPPNLDPQQMFTKLYIDRGQIGLDVIVVGDAASISEKLGLNSKILLKG